MHTLTPTPTETDLTTSNGETLHPTDSAFSICLVHELYEAAVFSNRNLHLSTHKNVWSAKRGRNYVVYISERGEESPERVFRNKGAEATDENGSVVRICTVNLLAVRTNKVGDE